MRMLAMMLALALFGVISAQAQQPLIYTALPTDVQPEIRAGRTFVPVRVISEQFGATVQWQPQQQMVLIQQANQPDIRLTIGSTTAQVGDRTVTLDAAPFITQGRTMVPLRFIAESYGVPITYDTATRTVRLTRAGRLYILPLESLRSGVVIETPVANQLVRNPILVQGVGNVFEGNLQVEVRDAGGRVLSRTFTTAGMGGFYPFSIEVFYNNPFDDAIDGSIVVYSQNGRGDGRILAQDTVRVRLASTR